MKNRPDFSVQEMVEVLLCDIIGNYFSDLEI